MTFKDAIINPDSNRCEGKGHIVLVNALSKILSARSRAGEEVMEDMNRFRQEGLFDLGDHSLNLGEALEEFASFSHWKCIA
jgi:hypothetical protein